MNQTTNAATTPLDLSYRHIIAIAAPVLIANLAMPLQGAIDVAVVGHFPNAASLAGLGVASQLWLLILVSFNFLQYASSGLSAQALGKQKATNHYSPELSYILYRALGLAVLLAAVLWLLRPIIINLGLDFLSVQPSSRAAADTYISIRFFGILFELMNYAFIGWFAGQGKTRQMMMVQLLISSTNIAMTLFFVYGLNHGIEGVAMGTVIGYLLGCSTASYLAYSSIQKDSKTHANVNKAQTRFTKHKKPTIDKLKTLFSIDEMLSLFSLNKDIFIRTLLLTLSLAWITKLSAQQGDLVMATNAVLLQVLSISAFALDGVAVAAESLSGQAAAHKNRSLFKVAVKRTGIITFWLALALSLIWLVSLPTFLSLMTDMDDVYALAMEYRYVAFILPLIGAGAYWLDGVMFGLTAGAKIRSVAIIVALIFFPTTWLINQQFSDNYAMFVIWFSVYLLLLLRFLVAGLTLWRHQGSLIRS